MIYLKGEQDGQSLTLIVLESANLEEMRKGHPVKTPDGAILIAWTADPVWLADKLMDTKGDVLDVAKLIDEAAKRPEKAGRRPSHKPHVHKFTAEE